MTKKLRTSVYCDRFGIEADQTQQGPVEQTGVKASEDPRFAKFFKFVKIGAKAAAVKLQMQTEGVDPTILE